jgi:hypothetical protein
MDKINLTVIRETFGKVVYTHKTYEKAADICIGKSKWIKRMNVFLLALTSGSALGSILGGHAFLISTSILATLSLFFVVYQLSFNFDELGQRYKTTAKKLWLIREKYQNLIADIMNEKYSSNELTEKRDSLLSELNEILENAPSTDSKAYSKARKALKIHEEMTFSNKEIDNFLPEELGIERKQNVK